MRRIIFLFTLLVAGVVASAQVSIPGTRVSFNFPDGGWKYLQTSQIDKESQVYLFVYEAKTVQDRAGDTVLPCLRIYVRNPYEGNMYKFIMERYTQQPYESLEEYTGTIGTAQSFGYVAAYEDPVDGKTYQMRMLSFKDGTAAIEFRLEVPIDLYPAFEKMFADIAATLQLSK